MAQSQNVESMLKPKVEAKLGLWGAALNAMALIAPGAFLWITFQLQAAATAPSGASVASDTWAGIVVALVVAFLTALSYSELAKIYPEAGFASCAYFAEKAFLDNHKKSHTGVVSWARFAKLATGWAAHLFYWVYPGVMVAFMATLIGYIYNAYTGKSLTINELTLIGGVFALVTGYIGYRGVSGSTATNKWINIVQWITLAGFSLVAIYYRWTNPQHATQWAFSGTWDIVKFHSLQGVMVQATIAILILVGFESCTALSAETKDPEKNIPKAIVISLVVQGLICYLFEYFATGYALNEKLASGTGTQAVSGVAAAAASSAPIGDLTRLIGDTLFFGHGFGLMIFMAITVGIATAGMAEDRELPEMLGFMHGKFSTPHLAMWLLVVVSTVIAGIGVRSVVGLTGITLASNLGTFILYGLTCVWTIVAFKDRADFKLFKHGVIPGLGVLTNIIMTVAVLYLYIVGNADAVHEAKICFAIAGGWALVSLLYIAFTTAHKSYRVRMVTVVIRPEQLGEVTAALKNSDLAVGMTVMDVRGFGRQLGDKDTNGTIDDEAIKFLPKLKLEVLVRDWDVERTMDIIAETLRTGNIGDGKIFVYDASSAMRIRTGERGVYAL